MHRVRAPMLRPAGKTVQFFGPQMGRTGCDLLISALGMEFLVLVVLGCHVLCLTVPFVSTEV